MDFEQAIIHEALQRLGTSYKGEITLENALIQLINSYDDEHNEYRLLYERYKTSKAGTPIFRRKMPDFMKIDNHLNNSFMSEIIDTKQGYMIGNPIAYSVKPYVLGDKSEEEQNKEAKEMYEVFNIVRDFCEENQLHDINMDTIKMASICGASSRLIYLAGLDVKRPIIKTLNIHPWETIFIYNASHTELAVAIRYYKKVVIRVVDNKQTPVEIVHIDVYDNKYMYSFEEVSKGVLEIVPVAEGMFKRLHFFKHVPLFEFMNNKEKQGDCDKILSLIDAYDRGFSDLSSELEQFRLAYIALYGLKAQVEDLDKLRQTGMFEMTKDGKVDFITKQLSIKELMEYFNRLENNIIRFSKSVNFKDENFYGNLSGVAIRYKLMQLEEKAMTSQVKFEVADSYMWKLVQGIFSLFNVSFDYYYIKRQFTRNIPVNMLEEARIQTELEGKVTTKTRMSIASFIEKPELEEQELRRERLRNKEDGINFEEEGSNAARLVDIDAGGPTNRNTNGTIEDM